MNAPTRAIANYLPNSQNDDSATAEDRLIFKLAAASMGTTDDVSRPMTRTLTYLDSILAGSPAINRLRVRYAEVLRNEAKQ